MGRFAYRVGFAGQLPTESVRHVLQRDQALEDVERDENATNYLMNSQMRNFLTEHTLEPRRAKRADQSGPQGH